MKATVPQGPRPNPLPLHERFVSHCFRFPAFFLATAFFGSLALLASLLEKQGRWQHRIAQTWARTSVFISGTRITILDKERLKGEPAVYICNHLSYMDTPVIFSSLPFQFRIVARHDLWKLPFIGWWLDRSGQVAVDVSNPRKSIASLIGAVKTLKAGMPLFIFPEGGRSESGDMAKFMNGPAFMAIHAQLPVVPMALIGTHELLPIHTQTVHPVPVTLVVGEEIETRGMSMKQVNELTTLLEERVAALYYEHSWRKRSEAPSATPERGAEVGKLEAVVSRDLHETEEARRP
ncbi:MAG: lysophospholipid acyltransferase family protein [Acidobacteriaceae bacterium]